MDPSSAPVQRHLSASAPEYIPLKGALSDVDARKRAESAEKEALQDGSFSLADALDSKAQSQPAIGRPGDQWTPWSQDDATLTQFLQVAAERTQADRGRRGGSSWSYRGERDSDASSKTTKAVGQLRQLLDFYFEPFNLQHNRFLLSLIARRVGRPKEAGPWPSETLAEFSFGFDELKGLGRIQLALSKMRISHFDAIGPLKHLRRDSRGRLRLQNPHEVRSFVAASGAATADVNDAARCLIAVREAREKAATGIISVLSYALADAMMDQSALAQQRQSQLKRQLLLHHTDLLCLQGFDPDNASARGLAVTLRDEGYGFEWASSGGDANAVFWDASRFSIHDVRRVGSALAVDLSPIEGPPAAITVVSTTPKMSSISADQSELLANSSSSDSTGRDLPPSLIVCADCSHLGGASAASLIEGFGRMTSVCKEVLGEELCVPCCKPAGYGGSVPVMAPASELNRLRSPDAVLHSGLKPVLALSGHTERYMSTLPEEELVQQFPAFRLPLVAAFDWRCEPAPPDAGPSS